MTMRPELKKILPSSAPASANDVTNPEKVSKPEAEMIISNESRSKPGMLPMHRELTGPNGVEVWRATAPGRTPESAMKDGTPPCRDETNLAPTASVISVVDVSILICI